MLKKSFLTLLLLFITTGEAFAQQTIEKTRVEFDIRYWITDLESRARASGQIIEGSDFDVKNDLGLNDRNFPEIRLNGRITPRNKLRFEYFQVDYSGDKDLSRRIRFEGQDFNVNTRVVSDFDLKQIRVGYSYQFVSNDKVSFGPMVELRGVWLDATLAAPDEGLREAKDFAVPLPALGFDLDLYPHEKVSVFASVSGIPGNRFGHLVDADFGVKVFPHRNVGLNIGYRYFDVKGKDDDDFATVKIKGPAVGATVRF
jgi:hypothetical protein